MLQPPCGSGNLCHTRGYSSPDLLHLWESKWEAAEILFIYFLDFLFYRAAADTALSLSLSHPLPIFALFLFLWLKGNRSAGSCILHRCIFTCAYFYLLMLNEMIQSPTEACYVFCCGGGALFLVGRLSCPRALPVGDGDSYQNSCHMKLCPVTFYVWIIWLSNMSVWNNLRIWMCTFRAFWIH